MCKPDNLNSNPGIDTSQMWWQASVITALQRLHSRGVITEVSSWAIVQTDERSCLKDKVERELSPQQLSSDPQVHHGVHIHMHTDTHTPQN